MADKSEQQLTEELIQKQIEVREKFSKGQTLGMEPKPKPDKEAEAGTPKRGWRGAVGNIYDTIKGK